MVNDSISDMLTRLRNAICAQHKVVQVPLTNINKNILKVLQKEGYIKNFEILFERKSGYLLVSLKYNSLNQDKPCLSVLKKISRPGLRMYVRTKKIPKVLGGTGIAIISTSKGVMTGSIARNLGIGGEILCYIW
uniref:Small ribosomal subunit protein uS8c n=1 Tax=Cyanidium caldarium TaxID=2771 RepID=RR8_CYACA|nr:ribosomal protein S8 [Cyanidium caldarium]Q9TLU5.1 RecName: Full=Small ribosomal subunit protein uS8c; AltName: Full=30S ribosomal protein S8, chloroplastic [Cyanidium caldarium]AAF12920.1 unknown [Cyanidium caldarium]WDB00299.1 ribosomal protein S8 [Cyanidium caldarium]